MFNYPCSKPELTAYILQAHSSDVVAHVVLGACFDGFYWSRDFVLATAEHLQWVMSPESTTYPDWLWQEKPHLRIILAVPGLAAAVFLPSPLQKKNRMFSIRPSCDTLMVTGAFRERRGILLCGSGGKLCFITRERGLPAPNGHCLGILAASPEKVGCLFGTNNLITEYWRTSGFPFMDGPHKHAIHAAHWFMTPCLVHIAPLLIYLWSLKSQHLAGVYLSCQFAPVSCCASVEVHMFPLSFCHWCLCAFAWLSVSASVCELLDVWHDKRWPSLCALHPTPVKACTIQVYVVMVMIDNLLPQKTHKAVSYFISTVLLGPLNLLGHWLFLYFTNLLLHRHCSISALSLHSNGQERFQSILYNISLLLNSCSLREPYFWLRSTFELIIDSHPEATKQAQSIKHPLASKAHILCWLSPNICWLVSSIHFS